MNEAIGSKGTGNDLLKTKRIIKKKKVDKEIEELEKEVKKKQKYTLIKTVPLIVGITTFEALYDTSKVKSKKDEAKKKEEIQVEQKQEEKEIPKVKEEKQPIVKKEEPKKEKVVITIDGEEIVVYVEKKNIEIKEPPKEELKEYEIDEKEEVKEESKGIEQEEKEEEKQEVKKEIKEEAIKEKQEDILDVVEDAKGIELQDLTKEEFSDLSPENLELLDKLKSRRIIDYYEEKLKDIRFELRNIEYEYNILAEEHEEAIKSEELEVILDRLTEVIAKIEELKDKIKIENLDLYDENYIFYLIQESLEYFKTGTIIDDIKDSKLYILISEKLDELDKKKDDLEKEVEYKKEKLELKEEEFEELKERFSSIDKINNDLLLFQYEQEKLLDEIRVKINESTTEKERVETEIVGMTKQSKRLLNLLSLQMLLPGPRNAKRVAAASAAYLYFVNNVLKPNTRTRRYKIISVKDYSDSILDSIEKIDEASLLLDKTSIQIDKMIKEIKEKYSDYLDAIPECREMLSNLNKIKEEVKEKEYEMKKLKQQQELEYERNNAKVKTIGEYPVN